MTKLYVQPGNVLPLVAPYDVLSGAGFKIGQLFAVAMSDALSGVEVEGYVTEVHILAKVSAQAWTVGALVYWDNTAKLVTTVATANLRIGVATKVAANPSATGTVRLNGMAGPDGA